MQNLGTISAELELNYINGGSANVFRTFDKTVRYA